MSFIILPTLVLSNYLIAAENVCLVKIEPHKPFTNETYKTVICNNSYCCPDGCCDWIFNTTIVIFVVLGFICFGICVDACWRKFFKTGSQSINNETQEALILSSFNSYDDSLRGVFYGSNNSDDVPIHLQTNAQDK